MTRRGRLVLKVVVWAACLAPLAVLGSRVWNGDLTANPISFITNWLGDWTLRILLTSLAMTPLRILFRWSWPVALRRLLGLFAFFYASLHFCVWLVLDHFFAWREMGADIVKRPYITIGMTALTLMIPLAATSTAGAIRRLGGARWQWLHRLVYVIGVCAVLHYLWLAKKANPAPKYYAAVLVLLLGIRMWDWTRRRVARLSAASASGPSPRPSPQRGERA
ncbi:MAG TPA: protein-methionine-sulfoxide reductase heme-binding subunit MsrQ [Methylomirabilota bacterium]|nr:protein-methionine-sulfoxide reductase heme-binding subunit MsrQ [Methylomirabilota bacterium]